MKPHPDAAPLEREVLPPIESELHTLLESLVEILHSAQYQYASVEALERAEAATDAMLERIETEWPGWGNAT